MKKTLALMSLLALVSCNESKSNSLSGSGAVRQENTIEFSGFVLIPSNGSQYDISHVDAQFKQEGLLVEFEGNPRNEILPAGVPQKIDFKKLTIVGIEN